MVRVYLARGLLAGLLAAVLAAGFAKVAAEPQIAAAERFEAARDAAHGARPEKAVVSRRVQDTVGLGAGVLVAGTALGGLYALVFALVHGRMTRSRARLTAMGLAALAFTALVLVPFLKYPANPPAVGRPDTIGHRTAVYFVLLAVAILAMVAAVEVRRRLLARLGARNATVVAAVSFVTAVVATYVVMPGVDEVPSAFPATVLWRFRLASLGTQLVLWAALGLAFGWLTERHEARLAHAGGLGAP